MRNVFGALAYASLLIIRTNWVDGTDSHDNDSEHRQLKWGNPASAAQHEVQNYEAGVKFEAMKSSKLARPDHSSSWTTYLNYILSGDPSYRLSAEITYDKLIQGIWFDVRNDSGSSHSSYLSYLAQQEEGSDSSWYYADIPAFKAGTYTWRVRVKVLSSWWRKTYQYSPLNILDTTDDDAEYRARSPPSEAKDIPSRDSSLQPETVATTRQTFGPTDDNEVGKTATFQPAKTAPANKSIPSTTPKSAPRPTQKRDSRPTSQSTNLELQNYDVADVKFDIMSSTFLSCRDNSTSWTTYLNCKSEGGPSYRLSAKIACDKPIQGVWFEVRNYPSPSTSLYLPYSARKEEGSNPNRYYADIFDLQDGTYTWRVRVKVPLSLWTSTDLFSSVNLLEATEDESTHHTLNPSDTPTHLRTPNPTSKPTHRPSPTPSSIPTGAATDKPTLSPTSIPTETLTDKLSPAPISIPIEEPPDKPSSAPTSHQTEAQTHSQPHVPDPQPTEAPNQMPDPSPTASMTHAPNQTPRPTRPPPEKTFAAPTQNPTLATYQNRTLAPAKAIQYGLQHDCNQIDRSRFNICLDLRSQSGEYEEWMDAFVAARNRWEQVITDGHYPPINLRGKFKAPGVLFELPTMVDDIYVSGSVVDVDGPGGILGLGGPRLIRNYDGKYRPRAGLMKFDSADINHFSDAVWQSVIIHELGHVLGAGSMIQWNALTSSDNSFLPDRFLGMNAQAEWQKLCPGGQLPVETDGGKGTAGVHWDEACLRGELMTGYLSPKAMQLSSITIASLMDIGYSVDMSAADPFTRDDLGKCGAYCPDRPDPIRYLRESSSSPSHDIKVSEEGHEQILRAAAKELQRNQMETLVHLRDIDVQHSMVQESLTVFILDVDGQIKGESVTYDDFKKYLPAQGNIFDDGDDLR